MVANTHSNETPETPESNDVIQYLVIVFIFN